MKNPLTREQEALRGRRVEDMSDAQLKLWLDACDRMERWVTFSKARRTWKRSREDAIAELERRKARKGRLLDPAGYRALQLTGPERHHYEWLVNFAHQQGSRA